jgi:anti-sigma28 factor (negative regulator of flagellin synthesis)
LHYTKGEILKVLGTNNFVNVVNETARKTETDKKENQPVSSAKFDKVEISEKAKLMNEGKVSTKNLEEIKTKIDSGYYNSDEVLSKVADGILKDIKGS